MIPPGLLAILVCPKTHQPLAPAGSELLQTVNARVAAGQARTAGGEIVREPVEDGLVRQDGRVLYPICKGLPILLVDEGIVLSS